jgi:8-oxo-dGTP pyrophosphatase MutT (NUDIX family)
MKYEVIALGKWLEFCKIGNYEFFHRHNKPNGVIVFATTTTDELIAVEQFRVPHGHNVLEAPAGLMDEGETPIQTARRELLEETGYGKGRVVKVFKNIAISPGICTETLNIVILEDVQKIGEGGGLKSENENIKVHLIPLHGDVFKYLKKMSKTCTIDLKLLTSLFYGLTKVLCQE